MISRKIFLGGWVSLFSVHFLSVFLSANLIPDIEDYQQGVPTIRRSQKMFPQKEFGTRSPGEMKVMHPNQMSKEFSRLGQKKYQSQPGSNQIHPEIKDYSVKDFQRKEFGNWRESQKSFAHRNLKEQKEMNLVSKYAQDSKSIRDFAPNVPYKSENTLDTSTLKDLNRFTPMRNASKVGEGVPEVRAGGVEASQ